MKSQFQPWQLLLLILAGWINRRQQVIIDYLLTENHILREKLGKKRILLNDGQRRRLAIKGKILGRKLLDELAREVKKLSRAANDCDGVSCRGRRKRSVHLLTGSRRSRMLPI